MYCSNCGTQNDNSGYACKSCGAAISLGHEYAGYWRRYGAYLLDMVILYICFFISLIAVTVIAAIGSSTDSRGSAFSSIVLLLYFPALFLFVILFFAFFESSGAQASPGKMAVGMIVVDMDGNRISFGRAVARQFLKIVSAIILGIGFIMCGFTEKRQGLHDMIAGTLVVMKKPVYFIEPRSGPRQADNKPPVQVIS